jgi:hypothetical protein
MSYEDRLAMFERRLHRTRLVLGVLLVGLLLMGTMAANDGFTDLVCRSLKIKNADGKTVIELNESGELKAGGKVTAHGADILAELASLKGEIGTLRVEVAGLRTELSGQQNKIRVHRFTHKLNHHQVPEDIDFGQPVERAEVILSGIWLQRRNDEAGDFGWKPKAELRGNVVRVTFQRMGLGGHDASELNMTVIAWLK